VGGLRKIGLESFGDSIGSYDFNYWRVEALEIRSYLKVTGSSNQILISLIQISPYDVVIGYKYQNPKNSETHSQPSHLTKDPTFQIIIMSNDRNTRLRLISILSHSRNETQHLLIKRQKDNSRNMDWYLSS
jgi:hypothetical protein